MVYTEKQSMAKFWWVLLIAATNIVMLLTFWLGEEDPAKQQELLTALLISVGIEVGVLTLIFSMSLKTRIDEKEIQFSFKPFLRNRSYKWNELSKVWVRKYKPISEFGGWGFKGGRLWGNNGRAYNVWGDKGLQLELKNGKRILVGTQNHNELVIFLKRLKEKHGIDVIEEAELTLYKK